MTLRIGRQGWLGLGIETTPGTPVAATTTIPFISNTLQGKHTPTDDMSARASRAQNFTSIVGKQWGEGQIDVNVDTLNVGFLLKLGLGNEIVNTVTTGTYDHLFYTTTSGNTPTTATLYNYQGVDTQLFSSMTVDKLDIDVKDAMLTAKAAFKGFFPTSGSYAPVTVSGTLLNFTDYQIKLGSSLVAAAASVAVPVTDFSLSINNNAEVIFESGKPTASRVFWKELKITGSFTRFFETVTDRDNYYNLNKQSLILTASGVGLPGGYAEALTVNLAKLEYTDVKIATGTEAFFAVTTAFTAEVDVNQGKQIDIILRNFRSSVYT